MSNTIQEVLEKLRIGNENFVADRLNGKLQDSERRNSLTTGQQPHAIVLSCADSRVVPELTFDAGLGELFIIRVAGNVANVSSVASIEYAVHHLGTKVIIVMGHESCGAVTAAMAGGDNGKNLNTLLGYIQPAVEACGADADLSEVVKKNAQLVSEDLSNKSTIIKDALDSGSIKIVPAYYNLDTGKVDFL